MQWHKRAASRLRNRRKAIKGKDWVDGLAVLWDRPTMIVTLDSKRRLTIPKRLAPMHPGDHFEAQFDADEDTLVFRRIGQKGDWVSVMKECPVPMDDLAERRRSFAKRPKL